MIIVYCKCVKAYPAMYCCFLFKIVPYKLKMIVNEEELPL